MGLEMRNTHTGVWMIIDWWRDRQISLLAKVEREEARERELAIAKERIRRDQSAAAFDRKILGRAVVQRAPAGKPLPAIDNKKSAKITAITTGGSERSAKSKPPR